MYVYYILGGSVPMHGGLLILGYHRLRLSSSNPPANTMYNFGLCIK